MEADVLAKPDNPKEPATIENDVDDVSLRKIGDLGAEEIVEGASDD